MSLMTIGKVLLWLGGAVTFMLCMMIYREFESEKNKVFRIVMQSACILLPTAAIAAAVFGIYLR